MIAFSDHPFFLRFRTAGFLMVLSDPDDFVSMLGVTKRYAGVTALDNVDFRVSAGEAVCLAGENGSGKSTLLKILAGVEQPTEGVIRIDGLQKDQLNPRLSAAAGIMVIFQDFSLFPNLTVAENITFANQLTRHRKWFRHRDARSEASAVLERIGVDIPIDKRVESLPVAHKQLVAIARALASEARLIIMDEPTTALTEREVRSLLRIIQMLKKDGVAVVFVSHKLAEVLEVSERVVVLRNGYKVAEGPAREFDTTSLTRHMTGRDVPQHPPTALMETPETLMQVKNLNKEGSFRNVSFDIRKGEVLGITGLLGSGRTSLAKALFGLVTPDSGQIRLNGRSIPLGDQIYKPTPKELHRCAQSQIVIGPKSIHKVRFQL